MYYHEKLKLSLDVIKKLKKMNVSYPENTVDYDEDFIFVLAAEVFQFNEIEEFLKNDNLLAFSRDELQFVKG